MLGSSSFTDAFFSSELRLWIDTFSEMVHPIGSLLVLEDVMHKSDAFFLWLGYEK